MTFRPLSLLRDSLAALGGGGPVWRGGAGDMVLTLYDDGIIVEASSAADDIIGAAGPLQGRSLYDFVRREDRDAVRAALSEHGVPSGIYYDMAIHEMPAFAHFAETGSLPECEKAAKESLSLPMHPYLSETQVHKVCDVLIAAVKG